MSALREELHTRGLARYSMRPTNNQMLLVAFAVLLALGLPIKFLAPSIWRGQGPLVALFLVVGTVVGVVLVQVLVARRRIAWLEGLDLPLDRVGYLDTLNNVGGRGHLVAVVELAPGESAPPIDVSGLPGTKVEETGGVVRLVSPPKSLEVVSFNRTMPYHAGKLHRWFEDCVNTVIAPLARAGHVASVRTEFRPS